MKDCIKRKINLLKTKNLFSETYEIIEVQEHHIVDSEIEIFKMKSHNPTVYYSTNGEGRVIYCKYCGEVIYKK